MEFSEWATPMVHVPKADGTTRSCGDDAVTVNPQLHVPQYPISPPPPPEDVFLKLRGGQRFTKLDLRVSPWVHQAGVLHAISPISLKLGQFKGSTPKLKMTNWFVVWIFMVGDSPPN